MPFEAVIFDWDGVVIHSAATHERSWEMLAAERNLPLAPDHFARGFGRKNAEIIPDILGWTQDPATIQALGDRKEELYRELLRQHPLTPLPGVRTFLAHLDALQLPRAVGSSTPRANLDAALSAMGMEGTFQALVSAESVSRGKPAPDVFLRAAHELRVRAENCIVLEDATFGITAAKAAGMYAVGVTTGHSAEILNAAGADMVVDRLDELSLETLASTSR